jgi:hypothetical protein
MSKTGLEVFDETIHKTNAWLKEISRSTSADYVIAELPKEIRALWPQEVLEQVG